MKIVNIHQAKTQFSRYVDQATYGESIIITRAGRPVARLVPLEAAKKTRQLGLGKTLYSLPANFDSIFALYSELVQVTVLK